MLTFQRGIDEAVKSRTSKGRAEQAERRRAEQEAHQRADALKSAVEYCHQRNVQVYLTANTLVADDEMGSA